MTMVFIVGIVVLEYLAPALIPALSAQAAAARRRSRHHADAHPLAAQLFFYLGGIASATLFARKRFVAASMSPLIYNIGIITGGAVFGRRYGIASLAWGALAGAFVGQFFVLVVAAWRAGMRYRPSLACATAAFASGCWRAFR